MLSVEHLRLVEPALAHPHRALQRRRIDVGLLAVVPLRPREKLPRLGFQGAVMMESKGLGRCPSCGTAHPLVVTLVPGHDPEPQPGVGVLGALLRDGIVHLPSLHPAAGPGARPLAATRRASPAAAKLFKNQYSNALGPSTDW